MSLQQLRCPWVPSRRAGLSLGHRGSHGCRGRAHETGATPHYAAGEWGRWGGLTRSAGRLAAGARSSARSRGVRTSPSGAPRARPGPSRPTENRGSPESGSRRWCLGRSSCRGTATLKRQTGREGGNCSTTDGRAARLLSEEPRPQPAFSPADASPFRAQARPRTTEGSRSPSVLPGSSPGPPRHSRSRCALSSAREPKAMRQRGQTKAPAAAIGLLQNTRAPRPGSAALPPPGRPRRPARGRACSV